VELGDPAAVPPHHLEMYDSAPKWTVPAIWVGSSKVRGEDRGGIGVERFLSHGDIFFRFIEDP
jgi:hypothetical protein